VNRVLKKLREAAEAAGGQAEEEEEGNPASPRDTGAEAA
jgi:hypothetical protein